MPYPCPLLLLGCALLFEPISAVLAGGYYYLRLGLSVNLLAASKRVSYAAAGRGTIPLLTYSDIAYFCYKIFADSSESITGLPPKMKLQYR